MKEGRSRRKGGGVREGEREGKRGRERGREREGKKQKGERHRKDQCPTVPGKAKAVS